MINHDVFAKALLQRAGDSGLNISHLKLQKLAYYCQGYHLALHNEPLFNAPICAWKHGPVVPGLFHDYKVYGEGFIAIPTGHDYLAELTGSILQVVDFVIGKLGRIGAWELVAKTHQEKPWLSHCNSNTHLPDQREINHQELKDFFSMEVVKVQDTAFARILDAVDDEYIVVPKTIASRKEFSDWILSA